MTLELLDERATVTCLLVEQDRPEAELHQETRDRLPGRDVPAVHDQHLRLAIVHEQAVSNAAGDVIQMRGDRFERTKLRLQVVQECGPGEAMFGVQELRRLVGRVAGAQEPQQMLVVLVPGEVLISCRSGRAATEVAEEPLAMAYLLEQQDRVHARPAEARPNHPM